MGNTQKFVQAMKAAGVDNATIGKAAECLLVEEINTSIEGAVKRGEVTLNGVRTTKTGDIKPVMTTLNGAKVTLNAVVATASDVLGCDIRAAAQGVASERRDATPTIAAIMRRVAKSAASVESED